MYAVMNRMLWMMPKTALPANADGLLEKWRHREAGLLEDGGAPAPG